ncbi:hypothetical protein MCC93_13150 [Morococcus cerebrosus]|uniref:Uncharacterized protein n=1 Tax=Morococcus cerebrosus TaxID=1056807 RepID=A0A0C1E6M7_9NEIS|nr:hypothetical protein MCC93_13150 [Morococcus cerebrosus]
MEGMSNFWGAVQTYFMFSDDLFFTSNRLRAAFFQSGYGG